MDKLNIPQFSGQQVGSPAILGLAILAFAALLFFNSFTIIPPGHRGISVILGKVNPTYLGEGPKFKWPFIETVVKYPVMQLKADGKAETFSSDLQQMAVQFAVMYRVPEQKVVTLYQQYRGDPYANLIEPRVQEAVKQITASHRAEEIVKKRELIKTDTLNRIRDSIGDLLTISDLSIMNIDLSDQLEHAIEQKVVREQEALAKQFELDKEKRQAEITIVRAEAEAKAVQIKGNALKATPEVVQYEIAQRWDGKAPLSVAVGEGGANVLLPLK
jgi:prohibitin 2